MEGWASRIIDTDRDHDLEDIDGYWYTLAPVTLFTFIHQQLDVAHATTNSMVRNQTHSSRGIAVHTDAYDALLDGLRHR
jgi:hypothetical protein